MAANTPTYPDQLPIAPVVESHRTEPENREKNTSSEHCFHLEDSSAAAVPVTAPPGSAVLRSGSSNSPAR